MICEKASRISVCKKMILTTPIVLMMVLMTSLTALAKPEYEAGVHYEVLETPVRTRNSSKIEVVEVFWYGCSHCYSFEPLVTEWKKKQAEDVDFWRSPAIWDKTMALHARAYFTAKQLKVMDKLHTPLFTTLLVERKPLVKKEQIEDLFADYGVERAKFARAFNSFSVDSQVKQADARARSYKVSGTPEMVVNGKYRVSARMGGGQAQMLAIVDYLIAKERALLAAK